MLRVAIYYAASVVALSFFGCEVCPFIHSLGHWTLAAIFAVDFSVLLVLRRPLERAIVERATPLDQPRRQFQLDLGLYVVAGLALALFDVAVYGFPVASGLRATLGCATVGLYCGLDTALARERAVVADAVERRAAVGQERRSFSLTRKFALIAMTLLTLVTIDLLLLALNDMPEGASGRREVAIESAVTLVFLLALTINLVTAYSRNLRLFLDHQRRTLELVANGRLDVSVPVASRDEFAAIARHTNEMIGSLRERERMRDIFGKLVSPAVAERLLATEGALNLGGSRRRVVILFSDVRGFTARTEVTDPEELVADLNRYFTTMVEIVHAHRGIVDKFLGDGLMAIFGLESFEGAADDAICAAVAMQRALPAVNQGMSAAFAIGIGVHTGEVLAGAIGSPERLEFTFIGDAVNVAARIEGLTKEVDAAILVSADVHAASRDCVRTWPWRSFTGLPLKGKTGCIDLVGLSVDQAEQIEAPRDLGTGRVMTPRP